MIFHQIRSTDETGTLSYLLADEQSKQAALIDPNIEDIDRLSSIIAELGLTLTYVIDTHTHADHVSAAGELAERYGSRLVMHENTKNKWKVVDLGDAFGIGDILRANAKHEVGRYVNDGDTIEAGSLKINVLFTPGHTDNHISLLVGEKVFTGDLLLIGQAGRSDLPGGNPAEQYESLFEKIIPLPDATKIYPGHDYEENEFAFLHDEKETNPFLQPRTKEEYIEFVKDFFPPLADAAEGGKVTLQCGVKRVSTTAEGFADVGPDDVAAMIKKNPSLFLLDVREPFELAAFGAIPAVYNISIREIGKRLDELPKDKSQDLVVVCQSGSRSYEVAHFLTKEGYKRVYNLDGGTSAWVQRGHPVQRGTRQSTPATR